MSATEVGQLDTALELFNQERYDDALPILEDVIAAEGDPRARYGRAMCLLRLDRADEAETELADLVRDHPDNATYRAELEHVRLRTGDAVAAAMGAPVKASGANTLAALLENEDQAALSGERLLVRHRMLLSHRRFWSGVVALVALPILGWIEGELRDLSLVNADLREALAIPVDLVGKMAGLVVVVAVAAVVAAVLSSRMTTYVIWNRRIDITTGVLFRRHRSVWLYKLTDVQFRQNPVHMLAGTAALVLYVDETAPTSKRPPQIVGLGPTPAMQRLQEQLLRMNAHERRDMKKQFI